MLRPTHIVLASLIALSACAPSFEADSDAVLSSSPDSSGFLVVGLAEENATFGLGSATDSLAIGFVRAGSVPVVMTRYGCGSMRGFYGSKPCNLTHTEWQVLKVQPGDYKPLTLAELTHVLGGRKLLQDQLQHTTPVHVGPGEVVYIGDFILGADYDAQEIVLRKHERDDAAAASALAKYPGLRNAQVVYRDPIVTVGQR